METDSSDEDSSNSIPRPVYEAISAIDSPRPTPTPLDDNDSMEQPHHRRLKYVVSGLQGTVNGDGTTSANLLPDAAAPGSGHSLTMKLTKVTHLNSETLPSKSDAKVRGAKEMLALKKSHINSKVLTDFVTEGGKMKRRKSRSMQLFLAEARNASPSRLSRTLPRERQSMRPPDLDRDSQVLRRRLKRSQSIPTPVLDSDEDWHHGMETHTFLKRKLSKKRGFSLTVDGAEANEYLHRIHSKKASSIRKHIRSRSKTLTPDSSWSHDERQPRRGNMRSENQEFAKKHSAFLDRIINDPVDYALDTAQGQELATNEETPAWNTTSSTVDTDANASIYSDVSERQSMSHAGSSTALYAVHVTEQIEQRLHELWQAPPRLGWDPFCWKCRSCGKLLPCSKCLRSYHKSCVRPASTKFDDSWKCPECVLIESAPKRPRRNDVTVDLLSQLLAYALERMKHVRGVYKLRPPYEVLPQTYTKYFVNPVSFDSLSQRIKNRAFHSVDEFLSEVKWMQHNALILDSGDIKVEQASKAVVKVCRQEANEIDTCAECYLNANSSEEWFVKVCTQPHLLLWAKLKGFPYWPAKAMGNGPNAVVNVRFFGKHDRANVPIKDCFLYSAQDPNTQTSKRSARDLADCIREVEIHIEHIKTKIGSFNYAPYRTPYDPLEEQQQLEQMMPGVHDSINRQLAPANKTPLQFLIRKTAGDKLSIVKKSKAAESGNESDQSSSPGKHQKSTGESNSGQLHAKPQSSNYEVIPRAIDALSESRSCTVILKRKSLEACKPLMLPRPHSEVPTKRKHSLSDASCSSETSQQGAEHKRRAKHARRHFEQLKQLEAPTSEPTAAEPTRLAAAVTVTEAAAAAAAAPAPASQEVVSVVEIVRKRQGVTITKIQREQQQQAAKSAEAITDAAIEQTASSTVNAEADSEASTKQGDMERQQQKLISKVVPFVEIKTEQLSEPEEAAEAVAAVPAEKTAAVASVTAKPPAAQHTAPASPGEAPSMPAEAPPVEKATTTAAVAAIPNVTPAAAAAAAPTASAADSLLTIHIKEEVISDEEAEAVQSTENYMPPPQPHSTEEPPTVAPAAAAAPTVASTPLVQDNFVRFVGDTTIQRLSSKQQANAASKTSETTATQKRASLRGVLYGPLPAAASLPATFPMPMPAVAAAAAAAAAAVAKPPAVSVPSKPAPQATAQAQSQPQSQKSPAAPQQLRLKTDKPLGTPQTSQASPLTSTLLKSNMVVIPVDATTHQQHLPRSANGVSSNLTSSNLMAVPVPPLTAVSKVTLHAANVPPTAGSMTAAATLPNNCIPLPPLAELTGALANSNTEQPGLLSTVLNGISSEAAAQQQPPPQQQQPQPPTAEAAANQASDLPITTGMAQAISEILARGSPPKLIARPRGPLQSDGTSIFPSQAGPVSQKLKENAHKITDYFISVIEDTLTDLGSSEPTLLQARVAGLTLENERLKLHYERQLSDLQRSTDLIVSELRKTLESENKRTITELRQQSMLERMRAVEDAKRKQWCSNCMREAQLYCCWNTSYCDYPCQQMHWSRHSANCGQANNLNMPPTSVQNAPMQPPPQPPPQQQQQQQQQQLSMDTTRNKQKSVLVPNQANQYHKLPSTGPAAAAATTTINVNKKWPQPMISMMNPPPNAEYLKLPTNTYLRPVTMTNNLPTSTTLMAPHATTIVASTRNNVAAYAPKPATTLPVQRYNIPLPITVSSNTTFGLISEPPSMPPSQKPATKPTGRGSNKNSRARQANNSSSSSNNNNNNNNINVQGMRPNQLNQVYQQ